MNTKAVFMFYWLTVISIPMQLAAEETIVITAVSDDTKTDSLPAVTTVITEQIIEQIQPQTAADIFTLVPGIDIQKTGGVLQSSSLSIRGTGGERILILLNGRKLSSAVSGGTDLSLIPVDSIKRIEVIRGASGTQYGDGAIGGVINIITEPQSPAPEFSGSLRLGSYGLMGLHVSGQAPLAENDAIAVQAALSALRTESDFSYEDDGSIVRRDNADGWTTDGELRFNGRLLSGGNLRWDVFTSAQLSGRGSPGILEFPTPEARSDDQNFLGGLGLSLEGVPLGSLSAEGLYQFTSRHYTDSGSTLGDIDESNSLHHLNGTFRYNRKDDFRIIQAAGLLQYDFQYEALDSSSFRDAGGNENDGLIDRRVHSILLSEEIHFLPFSDGGPGRVVFVPQGRYQWIETYNRDTDQKIASDSFVWSCGLALPFQASQKAVLRGNIGTAYRQPSFQDLFWPVSAFAVGNPYLKPEKSFYYDISLILAPWSFFNLEITHFRQEIEDLIQWNPGPGGLWRPENIQKAVLTGLEVQTGFNGRILPLNSTFEIRGQYAYLLAKDLTPGSSSYDNQLPRRPFEQGSVLVSFNHQRGPYFSFQTVYTGYRFTNAQNTDYIPRNTVFNITAGMRFASGWNLALSCKNLLDEEYVHLEDYPVPGREFLLVVNWTWKEGLRED